MSPARIRHSRVKVKPVGDTIKPGPKIAGYFGSIDKQGDPGMTTTVAVAGYDPATGQQVWYAEVPGTTNTGNLVTAVGGKQYVSVVGGNFVFAYGLP